MGLGGYPAPASTVTTTDDRTRFDFYLRKWTFAGIGMAEGYGSLKAVTVPYWSLVLPLTLLSAWLILVKPRKAKPAIGSAP
jgi:hypothetical protein